MLRRLLLILLGIVRLEHVSSQAMNLTAACSAECSGQEIIEKFAGANKLTLLSGDTTCHLTNIEVEPNVSLLYNIIGDKNYTNPFQDGCFRPAHSTVLKEIFIPIESCSDLLINVECKKSTQSVFLISKQNPSSCLGNGLEEVERRFRYRIEVTKLDNCGEERGVWWSVKNWFKGAWRTVKGWF